MTTHSLTTERRRRAGRRAELWGRAAEDAAADWYAARGADVLARRARTAAGELDLVVRDGGMLVFVEVKARRSLAEACAAVDARRQASLADRAACWLADHCGRLDHESRFDVAAIDRGGRVAVLENALAA